VRIKGKASWMNDPHKKAGRVMGEGGQIEMEL
jgi:hypothetical protein